MGGPSAIISCTFDDRLYRLFLEENAWEKMDAHFEVPSNLRSVTHRRDNLIYVQSQIMLITRVHAEIYRRLSTEECTLFGDYLQAFGKVMRPGFSNITWSSKISIVDRFVQVC